MVPSVTTSKLPRLVHPAWHSLLQRTRVRRREFKEMGYTKDKPAKVPMAPAQTAKQSLVLEDKNLEKVINRGLGTKLTGFLLKWRAAPQTAAGMSLHSFQWERR